jgi:hypothetical protein
VNDMIISDTVWRELPPELRAALRRTLKRKSAIFGRQVLAIARDLCHRGAYELVLMLYDGLDGIPPTLYKGCGLGLFMSVRAVMGEDPAPIGDTIVMRV